MGARVERATWRRAQLARLTILRFPPDDVTEWLVVLADVSDDALERGVTYALKTRTDFPRPADLLRDVALSVPRYPERVACPTCSGSGWMESWCSAHECGRERPHDPHWFVRPCACRRSTSTHERA